MNSSNIVSRQIAVGVTGSRLNLLLVCLFFVCSGLAALIYQTVWARKFALVFGTSELAIASVLASYMGGLALGAWCIQRHIKKVRRPLLWFAGIEAGIAIAALVLVPAGHWVVDALLMATLGGQSTPPDSAASVTSIFYLLASFVVLLVPTSLMGATLPVLVRQAVHSEQQIGPRIGLLYACNTGGAVAGALLGALVLLPGLGLAKTVWVAAAVNLMIALLAYGLSRALSRQEPHPARTAQTIPDEPQLQPSEPLRIGFSPAWVLPLMLFSGAVSFLHEVLWTRMLGHVLGSSIYAFGVMLASFLAGIALGGGLGALLATHRQSSARWLAVSQLAIALAAAGAWQILQNNPLLMETMAERVLFGFGLLFALAFAIGLTYPLAVRVLAGSVDEAASASARVYSWNTVGAILGAVAGGFLIVPALRYEGAVQLAVISSCLLAVLASFVLFRPGKKFAAAVTTSAVALVFLFTPRMPETLLRYSPLHESGVGEMLYYDVGRSSAVVALRLGDLIELRTNGLPEAAIDIRGTSPRLYTEAWMAPLAVLARPQIQDLLVVGFGGGRVIEAVPPTVQRVDVIELEDKVIVANQLLTQLGLRDPQTDPLRDPRVNLIINDARGTLKLSTKKYDAIVSQPSHPWTAGASHLYTREFMEEARAHLNPEGIFVQWMNILFLDEDLLRSLVATLNLVYPHVRVYRPEPPTLLFLASEAPIEPERNLVQTLAAFAVSPDHYGRHGLNTPEDLVVSLVLDNAGSRAFASGAAAITDDNNRFAVRSVHDLGLSLDSELLGDLLQAHDPLQQADSFVYRELGQQLAFDYIGRRIDMQAAFDVSAHRRLERMAGIDDRYSGSESDPTDQMRAIVARAAELALAGEWGDIALMDAELAAVPWTSLWNWQALRLRIEWRVRLADMTAGGDAGADAVRMIERLSVTEPDPHLYLLRAMAAGSDPYLLTESLFRYALAMFQGQIALEDIGRDEFFMLYERFLQLDGSNRVYSYHDVEVRNMLAAAAEALQ